MSSQISNVDKVVYDGRPTYEERFTSDYAIVRKGISSKACVQEQGETKNDLKKIMMWQRRARKNRSLRYRELCVTIYLFSSEALYIYSISQNLVRTSPIAISDFVQINFLVQ